MTLTFLLDYQQISRTDKSIVVAGSVNYLRAKFSPKSDDWKLPVTALFNDMAVLLDENWECAVPWEVVQQAGQFTVSAFCGSLQTANTVAVPVVASGYKNGETPPEPTPDVYNQILGVMQEAKDAAETAQEAAEHAPTIIDGVWHKWDAESGEYVSTSVQAQGPEGEQGPKGDKGDRGDKGDTGATGAQGPIGPTGETGPVGPQGEKGDTGGQGPQGVPGTAATITIGSVTESEPGGDASVTNSGTASAAVLDFVIPRGETGPTGATGATGPAGLGVPQPTADDAGKIPVVNADGSGYELGNPAPEVDDTLSLPGSPADAAAVGEAIEAVSPDDESVGAKPWSSKKIVDAFCPAFSVSGNPVQCYPVAGYPLGVKASWEPRQEGSGDPSPDNIRPITGMDSVKVTRCDESYFDFNSAELTVGSYDVYTGAFSATGNQEATGKHRVVPGSKIMNVATDVYNARSFYWDESGDYIFSELLPPNEEKSIPSNAAWFAVQSSADGFGDGQQIVVYTAASYKPYTGTTATLTLPETIYGGVLDAVTGEGEKTWEFVEFDGTETWVPYNNPSDVVKTFYVDLGVEPYAEYINVLCDRASFLANTWDKDEPWTIGSSRLSNAIYISVPNDVAGTVEEWKPYLAAQYAAGTPVTVAYKLATPVPIQATGNAPIPALPGVNTIYSDADSVTVTGRADPNHTIQTLTDRIAALEDAATGG